MISSLSNRFGMHVLSLPEGTPVLRLDDIARRRAAYEIARCARMHASAIAADPTHPLRGLVAHAIAGALGPSRVLPHRSIDT
jgi:hypothetical protein